MGDQLIGKLVNTSQNATKKRDTSTPRNKYESKIIIYV
jgi:hypothetical protein